MKNDHPPTRTPKGAGRLQTRREPTGCRETLSACGLGASPCCEEWAEDDTYIEKVCEANGVPEQEIYGDSYGVPDIQMKVTSLVRKLGGSLPENEKEQQP